MMEQFLSNLFGAETGATISGLIVTYGLKLAGALITLMVGWIVISIICKAVSKLMKKKNVEPALRGFINSLVGVVLKLILIVSCVAMMGVELTSVVAIFGAAGLAIGMALSGTLQNFAGGAMILLFRPFRIGDFIESQGYAGSVSEVQLFVTILTTPDNKTIIIPNGPLSNSSLINYSRKELRRVDFNFGIAYGHDFDQAKKVLQDVIKAEPRIKQDADNVILLGQMADSSVNITVRVWTAGSEYWNVFFAMNEKVYSAFNANNISIPFPQMDVHIKNN